MVSVNNHEILYRISSGILVWLICILEVMALQKVDLPPPTEKFKFLMLLPFGLESHRNCFLPLAETLADRGHQVVILSSLPPKFNHPNIQEINHGVNVRENEEEGALFDIRANDVTLGFAAFSTGLPFLINAIFNKTVVRNLYNERDKFDLFIVDEMFSEPAYPFLVDKHYITIGTPGFLQASSSVLGNVLNPSYIPSIIVNYKSPFSFFQRADNLFWNLYLALWWRYYAIFPKVEKAGATIFPDLPPFSEIERKGLSLVLANTHFSLDMPIPKLPSQIEVGGMHCQPAGKLPQKLQQWIDGAEHGVVYFSIGSIAEGKAVPEQFRKILMEAFGKLKQRVIWKFESDLPDLPKNILLKKWLPQQDILGHPNVKLFITHGGLLSMQEAIYHSTPMIALPIFGDQPKNAVKIKNRGFGTYLIWEELTVDSVVETIQEVIGNSQYYKTVSSASEIFRDQPFTPLETAVWWTEYVARHKGAPELKSPAADLSWIEYLMLDVLLFFVVVLVGICLVVRKLYLSLFGGTKIKKAKSKRD